MAKKVSYLKHARLGDCYLEPGNVFCQGSDWRRLVYVIFNECTGGGIVRYHTFGEAGLLKIDREVWLAWCKDPHTRFVGSDFEGGA